VLYVAIAFLGAIGIGDVVLYIGSISRFTEGFSGLTMALTRLRTNCDAMRAYFEFMDIPVSGRQGSGKVVEGGKQSVTAKEGGKQFGTGAEGGKRPGAAGEGGKQPGAAGEGRKQRREAVEGGKQCMEVAEGGKQPGTATECGIQLRPTDGRTKYEVEFRGVSFRYPGT